jgi:isoamylase
MLSPFLAVIAQDPVLRQVKLIAEPWDVGAGGYQAGAFPPPWAEWNDRYRDAIRDFWRGASPDLAHLGYRLSGSSDLYAWNRRHPHASVDFITAHDGFTLRDLVSYQHKHNEANGEQNRDGTNDHRSWNCGTEGETTDTTIITQSGNNNAYCQDNETSWIDWSLLDEPGWRDLFDLTRRLIALRRAHPVLRQGAFFSGQPRNPAGLRDLAWFTPEGREMTQADWLAPAAAMGMYLSGRDINQRDPRGRTIIDDSFLVILHAAGVPTPFTLPGPPWAEAYEVLVDTSLGSAPPRREDHAAGAPIVVPDRCVLLLRVSPASPLP